MPLVDISNPYIIKFLVENYEKQTKLRMKWNSIHKTSLQAAATLQREEKGYFEEDVLKEEMVEGLASITRDNIVAARNRRLKPIRDGTHIPGIANVRKEHSIAAVGLGDVKDDPRLGRPDTDLSIEPLMRPIEPKQKKIIYKDLPVFGREVYLKNRSKIPPEKKYYLKECEGWEYGWRLKDSAFGNNAPKYGRVWRLSRDVLSKTGPQPDPPYYKSSDIPGVTKCIT